MNQSIVIILLMFMFMFHNFVKISNALKVPIIHPNSPESPLYIKNLTRQQRIEYLVHHSTNRARSISNFTNLVVTTPQEIYVKEGSLLLVKLGVGTFESAIPYRRTFYFHMDTGTDQTWLQCEDCQHYGGCFGNPPVFFRNSKSRSYNPIPCNSHPLCYTGDCVDGYCSYRIEYSLDHSVASGILAHESFTFGIGRDTNDGVKFNLVFGCNRVYEGKPVNTDVSGMLGLMWGRRSLVDQLLTQGVIHRDSFSYCVPHYDNTDLGGVGYLEIGTDDDNDYYSSTPLKHYGEISSYFIELNGISVGQTRLPIDPYIFGRFHDLGGSIIDSGCMFSYIAAGAYTILTRTLKDYFTNLGNYKPVKPRKTDFQFGLCYKDLEAGRTGLLPSITLHYSGADLELEPDNVFFHLTPNVFCLAMYPAYNGMSIVGAYQQSNFKFVYDRANLMLHFKKEYCHQSA